VFTIFGSGAEQSWNRSGAQQEIESKDEKTPLKENVPMKP